VHSRTICGMVIGSFVLATNRRAGLQNFRRPGEGVVCIRVLYLGCVYRVEGASYIYELCVNTSLRHCVSLCLTTFLRTTGHGTLRHRTSSLRPTSLRHGTTHTTSLRHRALRHYVATSLRHYASPRTIRHYERYVITD